MKVILKEKFRKLGSVGDVVEVKSGFARNYLMPNDICVQATKKNIAEFEARKVELIEISKKREAEAQKIAKKVENKIVAIVKQAADDGRLYGSVTSTEVAEQLNADSGTEIDKKQITISTAIKFLGFYQVDVDLGEGVIASIFINVSRSEAEAIEDAEKFKKGKIQLGPLLSSEEQKASEVLAPTPEESYIKTESDNESEKLDENSNEEKVESEKVSSEEVKEEK